MHAILVAMVLAARQAGSERITPLENQIRDT